MTEPDDPPPPAAPPEFRYRSGLVVLRRVRERPPPWMEYDPRADAYVAPGSRLPEVRAWAAEHGVSEGGPGAEALGAPLLSARADEPFEDVVARAMRRGLLRAGGAR